MNSSTELCFGSAHRPKTTRTSQAREPTYLFMAYDSVFNEQGRLLTVVSPASFRVGKSALTRGCLATTFFPFRSRLPLSLGAVSVGEVTSRSQRRVRQNKVLEEF